MVHVDAEDGYLTAAGDMDQEAFLDAVRQDTTALQQVADVIGAVRLEPVSNSTYLLVNANVNAIHRAVIPCWDPDSSREAAPALREARSQG